MMAWPVLPIYSRASLLVGNLDLEVQVAALTSKQSILQQSALERSTMLAKFLQSAAFSSYRWAVSTLGTGNTAYEQAIHSPAIYPPAICLQRSASKDLPLGICLQRSLLLAKVPIRSLYLLPVGNLDLRGQVTPPTSKQSILQRRASDLSSSNLSSCNHQS